MLLSQVERVAASSVLRSSEALCKLLRYFAERSVDHRGETLKEFQIAMEVFGRGTDFDPRLDATVRVHTSRLRAKLAEYYALEGAHDPLILDLPKGSYTLSVHPRASTNDEGHLTTPPAHAVEMPAPVAMPGRAYKPPLALWTLSIICLSLSAAVVYLAVGRPATQGGATATAVPPAFRTFWQRFVGRPQMPLVVFSNAEFVGRPETGMRYFDSARDTRDSILDHYTGVGEVLAMHELDGVFTLLNQGIRVKRGRLLSLDDAQNNNLIYLGSPSENLTLREIPTTQEFVFRLAKDGPRRGDLSIVNVNPHAGEDPVFFGSKALPLAEDYAVIALIPGRNSGLWVMILAGTTTIGTEAAVEFVCRERDLKDLVARAGTLRSGAVSPFEAVIRVKVTGGVPVESQIVALHRRAGS
ncbi:MAG TPA: hypothetical protein VGF59_35945 [Bryobacteraceae bacterium]